MRTASPLHVGFLILCLSSLAFAGPATFTVNDGPDEVSGDLVLQGAVLDLAAWTYVGAMTAPQGDFPGDPTVVGTKPADDDGDASVVDLNINFPETAGQSYVFFQSPFEVLPFVNNGTYRVIWTVSRVGFPTATAVPSMRLRHAYGNIGFLGNGYTFAVGAIAAPTFSGRSYDQMIDLLDVAAANGQIGGAIDENSMQLFFETVDFEGTLGGGAVELDDVQIQLINRAALGAGTIEEQLMDFSDPSQANVTGTFRSTDGPGVTVATTPANATITATFDDGESTSSDLFGLPMTMNQNGFGLEPFTPSSSSGRFFRGEFTLDASANSAATPLPQIRLMTSTMNPGQLYTNVEQIMPTRYTGQANPALAATLFTSYLLLPEGANLGAGNIGSQIGASVLLLDSANTPELGGTLVVNGIRVTSFPENILP